MSYLIFKNPGLISVLDLISMGDSDKRDDPEKIGKFDSGLKYALALLYRNGISIQIFSGMSRQYTIGATTLKDEYTNKLKEVLVINEDKRGVRDVIKYETGLSPQLGYNWELWMAFREIYSNCIDEDGVVSIENNIDPEDGTTIAIRIDDKVQEILDD